MKVPGWELGPFLWALWWGIDRRQVRQMVELPFRGRSCTLCKELQGYTQVMTYLKYASSEFTDDKFAYKVHKRKL